MNRSWGRVVTAALLAVVASGAHSSARGQTGQSGVRPAPTNDATAAAVIQAMTGRGGQPYTEADVYFMAGMIPHHAQAVLIAGWAPTHGAGREVAAFCERVVVAQRDEIALMQDWLRNRDQMVPAADATHHRMMMGGVEHEMLMPGMMNDEELAQLDRARGPEFDRLFLTFMIRHHEGAVTMVDQLFGARGAAHDDIIFKLASDIWADQTTEIHFMQQMLDARSSGGRSP